MTTYDFATVFVALVAFAGWMNIRFTSLPTSTAMLLAGFAAAAGLMVLQSIAPSHDAAVAFAAGVDSLDFPRTVLGYMLAFLLFAGAMQVDLGELRRRVATVASLATLGVLFSVALIAGGLWGAARLLGIELSPAWALVFGALIGPTDPVAVLSAAREHRLSPTLKAVLQGEALFNDGVAIVVFSAAVSIAATDHAAQPLAALGNVAVEAGGAIVLGAALGALAVAMMRAIDDYAVEVAITVALATGAYAAAQAAHLSGPIAVVAAGFYVGGRGFEHAMSDQTRRYVRGFWTLIDDLLNAALFLLLGLEVLVIPFDPRLAGLWVAAIALVTLSRFVVTAPFAAVLRLRTETRGGWLILSWGGMRGAISLALALSAPEGPVRDLLLSTTFAVVVASVLIQGTTIGRLAQHFAPTGEAKPRSEA